jgi:uncharacterized protein YjaG (DUF416 family)
MQGKAKDFDQVLTELEILPERTAFDIYAMYISAANARDALSGNWHRRLKMDGLPWGVM